jgi:glucosylceramidase
MTIRCCNTSPKCIYILQVIDLYYGVNGIGYTLGRVHIGSCDFSIKSYSFNDIAGDLSMNYFDTEVTHDNAQMLPLMRLAIDAAKAPIPGETKARGIANGVNILASPWSPPPWMKEPVKGTQNMTGTALLCRIVSLSVLSTSD